MFGMCVYDVCDGSDGGLTRYKYPSRIISRLE